jgi:hypothetical protein
MARTIDCLLLGGVHMEFADFLGIGDSLAQNTTKTILKKVIFEPSGKEPQQREKNALVGHFHFRVPQGNTKKVVAWMNFRKTQNRAKLGIRGDLILKSNSVTMSMIFKPNANYKSEKDGGIGEWTIALTKIADENYKIALSALIIACQAC